MRYFEQSAYLERSDEFDEPHIYDVARHLFQSAVRFFVVKQIAHPVIYGKAVFPYGAVRAEPIAYLRRLAVGKPSILKRNIEYPPLCTPTLFLFIKTSVTLFAPLNSM